MEQVSTFLKVPPATLIKTLLYDVGPDRKTHVAVLVRGDHDVNEAKLARIAGSSQLSLSGPQTIERLTGAPLGFAGPVKLSGVRLLVDHAVLGVVNGVTGANQAETHLVNVNPGRDFQPAAVADLRMITEEDGCPNCQGPLQFVKTIEAGHVFKLGTKYSQALGAAVQGADGQVAPMVMGCYGIGINRILATAIEQHHDEQGIIWPAALAPFQVLISVMKADNAEQARLGASLETTLSEAGIETLLDDRPLSPGAKLKDADLIGIPLRIVIGNVWEREQQLELSWRATKEKTLVKPEALVQAARKRLDNPTTP